MFNLGLKSQETEQAIIRMILRDGLKAGDMIISENRIATLLGISRTTVRQAIGSLVAQGFLRSENGRGTFVVRPPSAESSGKRKSGLIGLVCHAGVNNAFMMSIARGIEEAACEADMQLCVGSVMRGPEQEAEIIRRFIKHGVDGIIISPVESNPPSKLFLELCGSGAKIVVIDKSMPGVGVPCVACDDREGAFIATECLIKAGHRRIAHLCGSRLSYNAKDRFDGYRMALDFHSLPFEPALAEFAEEWSASSSSDAARKLLALPEERRPTAIFASNDILALDAWEVFKEHGLSVPADISLVGYGNLREPCERGLLLTTIDQQAENIGRQAWLLLEKLLDEDLSVKASRVLLKPNLVKRASVGIAPNTEQSA